MLDSENIAIAVRIVVLSCLQVDIYVFPVWRQSSWISDFRLRRTVFPIVPLDSLPRKHAGSRWTFVPILSGSWDLGVVTTPPRHFTFYYTDSRRSNISLKCVHQQIWKWVAPRCTEAFLKIRAGKIWRFKNTKGAVSTTPLGSSRVK